MRYTYLIKDQQGNQEQFKAMSYRKLLKKLSNKYSNKIVQINYIGRCGYVWLSMDKR